MKLYNADNREALKELPDNSVDSVITDPPYALTSIKKRFGKEGSAEAQYGTDGLFQRASKGFMGKEWDAEVPSVEFWREVYRVLKPGGHILSFGGTRTYHRMVVNIEDAGFEIRDQIMWIYGSGFPKSLNIGKAVDKIEGNEREVVGLEERQLKNGGKDDWLISDKKRQNIEYNITKGQTEWEGWGSALKPAVEPICLARKPLSEKSISENVLRWRTGGLNIDGSRVGFEDTPNPATNPKYRKENGYKLPERGQVSNGAVDFTSSKNEINTEGRFPANVILECICDEGDIHTNRDCPCYIMDEQSGVSKSIPNENYKWNNTDCDGNTFASRGKYTPRKDMCGSSRFFYRAKVSKKERNLGLDEGEKSTHPTVKPINLLTYLCRLITPPNGVVLDPFMGSGSTGIAALLEGFDFVGMELDKDYYQIAQKRIENYELYRKLLK